MAIITFGGGVAAASGSIAGTTFSRNKGGPYIRNRAVPTNPNTAYQQAVRSIVAQLTSTWYGGLNAAQRASWDAYAENVPLPNALGEPRNVGGLGMFVRSNVPRLQANPTDLPLVQTAPTIFNLGQYTAPVFAQPSAGGGDVDVTFTTGDQWVDEDDAAMLIYISRPANASINYFKGPYRYAGAILGDSTTPPTSPATIDLPFPVEVAHRVFFRAQVTRGDGRLSADWRGFQSVAV